MKVTKCDICNRVTTDKDTLLTPRAAHLSGEAGRRQLFVEIRVGPEDIADEIDLCVRCERLAALQTLGVEEPA